jgi:hypothetical protein
MFHIARGVFLIQATHSGDALWAGDESALQYSGPISCHAQVFDFTADTGVIYALNSHKYHITTDADIHQWEDMYNVSVDARLHVGNHWDDNQESVFYQCDNTWKIQSLGIWIGTALSEANIFALTNITSSPSGGDTKIGMVTEVPYTDASVTQPTHYWDFRLFRDGDSTLTDTGSAGNKPLTAVGSPEMGTVGWGI